jgi:plasmid stabilization system protein ParE
VTVVFTAEAQRDLDDILAYTKQHHAGQFSKLEDRFMVVFGRLERHPKSAPELIRRRGVRVASLTRYPFRVFYREIIDGVEILYIRHTARKAP